MLRSILLAAALFACCATTQADETGAPDLTKVLPADTSKVHHLGPTGLQGWMHVERRRLVPGDIEPTPLTVRARQIYITGVDEGSPADGVIQVGDVVLGTGDKPFDGDPRVALADAINEAEKNENDGLLKLLCWRPDQPDTEGAETRGAGSTGVRELKLQVLGTYSDTAPYDCAKSEMILAQTLDAVLSRGPDGAPRLNGKLDLSYLALLATGDKAHFQIVRDHVLRLAASAPEPSIEAVNRAHSWNIGYRLILLCEYYLMTRDASVLPGIKRNAVTLSMGQSVGGMWGHRMAQPSYNDGRLHARIEGYAALNQPSLTCFMGLLLARKCGVEHPELKVALDKANVYFRHHVGNGAIPYGYGPPREYLQSNNGTSGSAALAFAAAGDTEAARFFSRLSAGAHAKLEMGHTGTFFNTMWTGLGVNLAGPETYAAFFTRWTWLRTLARKWDGGFVYQGPFGGFNYRGLSADAAMVLHYALPRRTLLITGREQDESLWLKGEAAEAAANVWAIDYDTVTDDALLEMLGHDIPMVRGFAARELAVRGDETLDALMSRLKGSRNEQIGACNALAGLKENAAPALAELMALVRDEDADFWIRSRAARAIAGTGEAGLAHGPELLAMLVKVRADDPLRDLERYLAPHVARMVRHASFDYAAHKASVYPAALSLMGHPHVHARSAGIAMIENTTLEDFHLFADRIVEVVLNNSPEYTSYSGDRPRQAGLAILDRLNIEEGIALAIETIEPGIWGQKYRITSPGGRLAQLKKYGAHVTPYFPQLREVMGDKAEPVIEALEQSTVTRKLITLEEAKRTSGK